MMNFSGSSWRDSMYQPTRQWMDIRPSAAGGVYEATFDFSPALEGVMIISADPKAAGAHSKLLDLADRYRPEKSCSSKDDAFVQGYLNGLKRGRTLDDDSNDNHLLPKRRRLEPKKPPRTGTRLRVLCRGRFRVPDELGVLGNWCTDDEISGWLEFRNESLCEFDLTWTRRIDPWNG